MVTNIYRENRDPRFKYYNGSSRASSSPCSGCAATSSLRCLGDLVTKVNAFLAEGAKLTERDERGEELSPSKRVALRAIIKKCPKPS